MPVYDFRCLDCSKRFEARLTYSEYDSHNTICPACGSVHIERIIRKVRVLRGDNDRLSALSDSANLDALDDDPRTLGRMMKQMKSEVGATDLPAEFDEVVDRLEKGQSPDEIEHDLPDLGSDMATTDL